MIIQRVFDKDHPDHAVNVILTAQEMDNMYSFLSKVSVADDANEMSDELTSDNRELHGALFFAAYAFAVGDGDLQ